MASPAIPSCVRRPAFLIGFVALCAVAGAAGVPSTDTAKPSRNSVLDGARFDASHLPPDDGQWVRASKELSGQRYSQLREINAGNVSGLKLAWSFALGTVRGAEAAPIVANGTMYVVAPLLFALDLTKPGAPLKWKYEPNPDPASQGVACCDTVNRGAVYEDGRIFFNTLDGYTVGVDAKTGKELWKTKLGDIQKGETITMAPIVVKGRVLVGNAGGELGVRGWLTALDAKTGKSTWRAWSTGPDADVLIGPSFQPFYPGDRGKDLGVSTWPPDHWRIGGGTVWGWLTYSPALDLVLYGTANPGPWNPSLRPGDNKWTCGIFARRPETGEAAWFYQTSPHDLFDHDGINESILADALVGGQPRTLAIHPGRTGYVYVLDARTGEVLSATPFGHITTSWGVDLKSGRLMPVKEKEPSTNRVVRNICPAAPGSKDWPPAAFNPRTGLLYIPGNNLCQDEEGTEANYIAGTPYVGANVRMYAGPGGNRGEFIGWDVLAGKKVFSIPEKFPVWSGAVVTEGELVFYGTMDGWFKALNARTGQELWRFKVGSGIVGQPVTYRGPDGKQYVSVLSGVGGWMGVVVSGQLDTRDQSAALGAVNAMSDLPQATTRGGTLYTFALP
jgi:PQQ-dependent dehydrogenase (methanol/ethanol family)